jgi:hypothetical protein
MRMPKKRPKKSKPGPEPERLKIEGDWKDALKKTLPGKPTPPEGEPPKGEPPKGVDTERDEAMGAGT